MFFKSVINLDDGSSEEVSLAYIEEFWEYIKHADSSLVGSGNVQLYAAQVYYVIPVERILCKADIMRDPVTPRIPAGALPANHARRERTDIFDKPKHATPPSQARHTQCWGVAE